MKNSICFKSLFTILLGIFALSSFSQPLSCVEPNGNYNRPDSITHCKGSVGGSFNQHWLDRISAQGGISLAGIKSSTRKRSVFVNESINRKGGFAVLTPKTNGYNPDADAVGSTFAVDTDGDCIYEREDELLRKLQYNLFDEIILYNVSSILQVGDEVLVDGAGSQGGTYFNNLQVSETAEWHLARFIDKAKNMGFNVAAVVPEGTVGRYDSLFYEFHMGYAENSTQLEALIEEFNEEFFERYIDLWLYAPEQVTYKKYGEDTLFLPLDNDGRISDVDKAVVDLYNFAVFQFRAERGYITAENSDDPCSYTVENGCNHAFDAHFAEFEWWDTDDEMIAESNYTKLIGVMEASHNYRNSGLLDCYPELYVAQNQMDLPEDWTTWTSSTPQQRANTIDSLADRIYIYAYQRVPCDCYWGRSNSTSLNGDQNDWFVKAEYFHNNHIPTDIYPVFNGKFYDSTLYQSPQPTLYGDGNYGCNSNSSDCDYCFNRVGDAMRKLPPNADPIKLGYVENTWQEQYDFDPANSNPSIPNNIHGYAWFKSSVLDGGGVINSDNSIELPINNKAFVFPNPSDGEFQIFGNKALEEVQVFDLSGRLILNKSNLTSRSFRLENSGTYIVRLKTNNEVLTQKIVVTQ